MFSSLKSFSSRCNSYVVNKSKSLVNEFSAGFKEGYACDAISMSDVRDVFSSSGKYISNKSKLVVSNMRGNKKEKSSSLGEPDILRHDVNPDDYSDAFMCSVVLADIRKTNKNEASTILNNMNKGIVIEVSKILAIVSLVVLCVSILVVII